MAYASIGVMADKDPKAQQALKALSAKYDLAQCTHENCERMEDYHLWIRAIKKNIIIRNIPLPLVKSKLNNSFFKRRSSYQILKSEYKIYKLLIKFRKAFFVILTLTFFLKIFYHLSPIRIKPTLRKYINLFLN